MNLFIMGDTHKNDPDVFPSLVKMLDEIQEKYEIVEKVITFNAHGICDLAHVWAEEEDIPVVVYDNNGDHHKTVQANNYLRNIVDKYDVDAFLFVFLNDSKGKLSEFENNIRFFYRRTKKAFKSKTVFVNKIL